MSKACKFCFEPLRECVCPDDDEPEDGEDEETD